MDLIIMPLWWPQSEGKNIQNKNKYIYENILKCVCLSRNQERLGIH